MPFEFAFMRQAFLVAIIIAVPTALLSTFLVLKGWSLMGDAISHAVLPGIVLAYLAGIPLLIGAFVAGIACALLTGFVTENSRLKEDTVMGVVFSAFFAVGIVMITRITTDVHLDHILFGNILGVDSSDIVETGIIALIVVGAIIVFGRDILLFVFDPQQAAASGLATKFIHYGLLALLSLTIVSALKAVGIILAIAMVIAPGAIAFLLTRRFQVMQMVSVAVALLGSFLGIYLSFFLNSAPAPTIILVLTLMFLAAFAFSTWREKSLMAASNASR